MTNDVSSLPGKGGAGGGWTPGNSITPRPGPERVPLGRAPTPSPSLAGRGVAGDTSRLASADNLKKAGDKFESVFTGMMLGAMRKASLADTLFESKALDTFRDMQDQRIAESMATHSPIGIGKAMTEFLGRSQPDLNESPPTPAR